MEIMVASDSGVSVVAKEDGEVIFSDSSRIVIRSDSPENNVEVYRLTKFHRSNHNTCINQRPLVRKGDKVVAGEVLADGQSVDYGELALGQNLLVAYMTWNGYNFEDSILISEKVVAEDRYTSIHVQELSCISRDTKQGAEEDNSRYTKCW